MSTHSPVNLPSFGSFCRARGHLLRSQEAAHESTDSAVQGIADTSTASSILIVVAAITDHLTLNQVRRHRGQSIDLFSDVPALT